MHNLLSSCFNRNPFSRRRAHGASDSTLRLRNVLVRNSWERQQSHLDAQKMAPLNDLDGLMDDYDEYADERSISFSDKSLEFGASVQQKGAVTRRLTKKNLRREVSD